MRYGILPVSGFLAPFSMAQRMPRGLDGAALTKPRQTRRGFVGDVRVAR